MDNFLNEELMHEAYLCDVDIRLSSLKAPSALLGDPSDA